MKKILIEYKIRSVSRVLVLLTTFIPLLFALIIRVNNSIQYITTFIIIFILILSIRAILDKLSMDISESEIREYLKIPDDGEEIFMKEDIPYKTLELLLLKSMYYNDAQEFKNRIKDKNYKICLLLTRMNGRIK